MRTHALVSIALATLAACSNAAQANSTASPSAAATPMPLFSCESRELNVDGADVVVQANADRTLASILIVHSPNDDARAKAFEDARKYFGDPHPDTRTQSRQFKWGLTQLVDMCGRPVMPSDVPSPTTSPG